MPVTAPDTPVLRAADRLAERTPAPSPSGPAGPEAAVRMPPARDQARLVQTLRFVMRPLTSSLAARRENGDTWQLHLLSRREPFVVTTHPDHIEALFKAKADDAPSLTGESPLRPILGPNSVLTSVGPRHMRQRKLLLPPFHGEAVQRYVQMITEVAEREIDRWPVDGSFALAPRMQAITLDVIMGGVFGIDAKPPLGSPEHRMREMVRRLLLASTRPIYQVIELENAGRHEPRGILRVLLGLLDRQIHAVIRKRRAAGENPDAHDVLSLLLRARDEDGAGLTDDELRDQLLTLVLAGHETTANSLSWTFERLLRHPEPYARLRELVRTDDRLAADYVEATIHEGMRVRPVIPMIVRMVHQRWRFGDYVVPAHTPVAVNIVALHHREDVYPEPLRFAPERFLGRKPGTYTWIPFGGGIRRCLGATLAMAEQRVVLRAIARRVDLRPVDPAPEPARQRNVTMIPRHGGRVIVERVLPA